MFGCNIRILVSLPGGNFLIALGSFHELIFFAKISDAPEPQLCPKTSLDIDLSEKSVGAVGCYLWFLT